MGRCHERKESAVLIDFSHFGQSSLSEEDKNNVTLQQIDKKTKQLITT